MPITRFLLVTLAFFSTSACNSSTRHLALPEEPYPTRVHRAIGLYQQPDIEARIQRLGYRLAKVAGERPEQFSFHILDQEMPNAFAAPDNSVFVSRGLLALVNNEDALAGILAHELTHLTEGHHRQQARREALPELLMLPGKTIGELFGRRVENWMNRPMRDLSGLYLSRYSRLMEFEADRKGATLAAAAGYDPMALALVLEQMEQTNQMVLNTDGRFSYLDSHPPTEERVERITALAHSLAVQSDKRHPAFPENEGFLRSLDGLCFGPNPAYGILQENEFLHPEHGYELKIPAGWNVQRGPNLLGAASRDGTAAFFLGVSDFGFDPNTPADDMKQSFYDVYGVLPVEENFLVLESGSIASLLYRDRSGERSAALIFAWIELDGRILQFIGSGSEENLDTLKTTLANTGPIGKNARKRIEILRMRLVQALAGENLETLSARSGNRWSSRFTATANGIPMNKVFSGGEWVKIVRRESYATPPPTPPQNR